MKKLVFLVVIVVVLFLGFALGRGWISGLGSQLEESREQIEKRARDLDMAEAENQVLKAIDKLRDADLDAAANNFGSAREALRRALSLLEEACQAAEGNEDLLTRLDEIRTRLEAAREDLINLRSDAREKIEDALDDLHRLIEN